MEIEKKLIQSVSSLGDIIGRAIDESIKFSLIIFLCLMILTYFMNQINWLNIKMYITKLFSKKEISIDEDDGIVGDDEFVEVLENVELEDLKSKRLFRPRSFGMTHEELNKSLLINDQYIIRKIKVEDYEKGVIDVLKQLSNSPDLSSISKHDFSYYVDQLECQNKNLKSEIYVIEDKFKNIIVGTGSIIIETKLLHVFGKVAHVEDIVILTTHRKNGLGKLLNNHLIMIAKKEKCYKIILNCKEEFEKFYNKVGYSKSGSSMSIYFEKY